MRQTAEVVRVYSEEWYALSEFPGEEGKEERRAARLDVQTAPWDVVSKSQYHTDVLVPSADIPFLVEAYPNVEVLEDWGTVKLRSRTLSVALEEQVRESAPAMDTASISVLRIAHLRSDLTEELVARLEKSGIRLVSSLGRNAQLVALPRDRFEEAVAALETSPDLLAVHDFTTEDAIPPRVSEAFASETSESGIPLYLRLAASEWTDADLELLKATAREFTLHPATDARFAEVSVVIDSATWASIQPIPTLVNTEVPADLKYTDERQAMIMVKNDDATLAYSGQMQPDNPPISGSDQPQANYMTWLRSAPQSFPADSSKYPQVIIFDSGVDFNAIPASGVRSDFRVGGSPGGASRMQASLTARTTNASQQDQIAHGTLVASIAAGASNSIGADHEFVGFFLTPTGTPVPPPPTIPTGHNYGTGICPDCPIVSAQLSQVDTTLPNPTPVFYIGNSPPPQGTTWQQYLTTVSQTTTAPRIGNMSLAESTGSGEYTELARRLDIATRDSDSQTTGDQQFLFVVAAGNNRPLGDHLARVVESPGTAKNVLTVGGSQSSNPQSFLMVGNINNRCQTNGLNQAQSADNMWSESSRGPLKDGRVKPDVVAPATAIHGLLLDCSLMERLPTVSAQDCAVSTLLTCSNPPEAMESDTFTNIAVYPRQQTALYTWAWGTSLSAPAVSGMASLAAYFVSREYLEREVPSPALLKAYVVHSANWRTGVGTACSTIVDWPDEVGSPCDAGTVISLRNNQGYGLADMGRAFHSDTANSTGVVIPRFLVDQTQIMGGSGVAVRPYSVRGVRARRDYPIRVVMAYTDAPGEPVAAAALVNDLDLRVHVGLDNLYLRYWGNQFDEALTPRDEALVSANDAVPVGQGRDRKNNVEAVFVPSINAYEYNHPSALIEVHRASITGDGVPGVGGNDQDFALVAYNFIPTPCSLTVHREIGCSSTGINTTIVQALSTWRCGSGGTAVYSWVYRIVIPDNATGSTPSTLSATLTNLPGPLSCNGDSYPAIEYAESCDGPWTTTPPSTTPGQFARVIYARVNFRNNSLVKSVNFAFPCQ